MWKTLLLFIISFAVQVKAKGSYFGPAHGRCQKNRRCVFVCDVSIPDSFGGPLFIPPSVNWERRASDGRWFGLLDNIWDDYQLRFTLVSPDTPCVLMNGFFRCEYSQNYCCSPHYDGLYRCNLRFYLVELIGHAEVFPLGK